jgi:uncharacterized protein YjbI with pentapeptide repeats
VSQSSSSAGRVFITRPGGDNPDAEHANMSYASLYNSNLIGASLNYTNSTGARA